YKIAQSLAPQQDLNRRASLPIRRLDKLLSHHSAQTIRQHRAYLVLLIGRVRIYQTIDGLDRSVGVPSPEDPQSAGHSRQGHAYSLQVAQRADQDYFGILAPGHTQRAGKVLGVGSDLALSYQAFLRLVNELERVFYRHNVSVARVVDMVDHRGQRGRFAG